MNKKANYFLIMIEHFKSRGKFDKTQLNREQTPTKPGYDFCACSGSASGLLGRTQS